MKYRSEICAVMHQDALYDFKTGIISEAEMRELEEMCFVQEPETVQKTDELVVKTAYTANL